MKKDETRSVERKPLSDQELDQIFNPSSKDEKETVAVGRSYGWADTPMPPGPGSGSWW